MKMTIEGELALAESALSELKLDDFKTIEDYKQIYDPLVIKHASLVELTSVVRERCVLEMSQ